MQWTKASEAPDQFHFWTAVGTVAGALRSCVWIDQKIYKYTPNFFLFFVGPPGIATKSTSIGLGMKLLEQVPDIKFGPSSLTWQYLLKTMAEAVITIKWIDDHGDLQERPASPITIEASELGTFLKLSQDGLAETLIELWDGKVSARDFTHGTLTSGNVGVKNPWIHILGATTPAWLSEHFPEHMIGGGLTSRILFIFGDYKRQMVAYPARHWQGDEFESTERLLVEDLIQISQLRGPFKMTEEALDWGEDWYQKLWTVVPPHLATMRYEGYRARKQALLHKIAMVVSAATREDLVITKSILEEAEQHLLSTELAMTKVFESIGAVDEARYVREIVGVVRSYEALYPDGMPSDDIYSRVANSITVKDFEVALIAAIRKGALVKTATQVKSKRGVMQFGVKLGV